VLTPSITLSPGEIGFEEFLQVVFEAGKITKKKEQPEGTQGSPRKSARNSARKSPSPPTASDLSPTCSAVGADTVRTW
jgi:hypothetical protein